MVYVCVCACMCVCKTPQGLIEGFEHNECSGAHRDGGAQGPHETGQLGSSLRMPSTRSLNACRAVAAVERPVSVSVSECLLKVLPVELMGGLWAVGSKEDSRLLVLGNWKDPVESS